MVVLILECVPIGLRGELSRWFLEPKAGVFVGNVSALVRDKIWEKACRKSNKGGCLIIYSSNNEQGYQIKSWGNTTRSIIDFEGIFLVQIT